MSFSSDGLTDDHARQGEGAQVGQLWGIDAAGEIDRELDPRDEIFDLLDTFFARAAALETPTIEAEGVDAEIEEFGGAARVPWNVARVLEVLGHAR